MSGLVYRGHVSGNPGVLNETGNTSATTISDVHFQFGTTDGASVSNGSQVFTPEPASARLFIPAGISLPLIGRKSLLRSW